MAISRDPTYPLYPIFAFLGFLLSIIPLPWHIQAWNSGTVAYMLWTALLCLVNFVNSVVWAGSVRNVAPIWCDISTQVILGAAIGIPASTLCISRRLYRITSIRSVSITREDKRRAVIEDICIALGIPAFVLFLHIFVHSHRFDIIEDIGCYPATYNTLPAYFLYFMWPMASTFALFYMRRAQFAQFMNTNGAMSMSRYFRLMVLSIIDILFTVPVGSYVVYIGTHGVKLQPYLGWEDTHFNFGRIKFVPALIWRSQHEFQLSIELSRWLAPFCAILFFALFGFASEARKNYSSAFWRVARVFGKYPTPPANGKSGVATISSPPPKFKQSAFAGGKSILPLYVVSNGASATTGQTTTFSSIGYVNEKDDGFVVLSSSTPASPTSASTSEAPPSYLSSPTHSFASIPDESDAGSISLSYYTQHRSSRSSTYPQSLTADIEEDLTIMAITDDDQESSDSESKSTDHELRTPEQALEGELDIPPQVIERPPSANAIANDLSPPSTLRAAKSRAKIYLPAAYYPSPTPEPVLPSPPPFNNATVERHLTTDAPASSSAGNIIVTVHKSYSSDSV